MQSATPDKTLRGSSTCEQQQTFTLHNPSSASSTASRRLLASPRQPDCQKSPRSSASKRSQSSAVKRLEYAVSPQSDGVNGRESRLEPVTQALTTAMQRSPVCSPRRTVNGTSAFMDAADSHDLSPSRTSEAVHRLSGVNIKSPEVTNRSPEVTSRSPKVITRSPKVINRSPKVVSRSPKVVSRTPAANRSPHQRQLLSGSSVKRGGLVSPAGQPRTKKFIVERLRNAKTSRRKALDIVTDNKSSPVHKTSPIRKTSPVHKTLPVHKTSPVHKTLPLHKTLPVDKSSDQKVTGKCAFICSVLTVIIVGCLPQCLPSLLTVLL